MEKDFSTLQYIGFLLMILGFVVWALESILFFSLLPAGWTQDKETGFLSNGGKGKRIRWYKTQSRQGR